MEDLDRYISMIGGDKVEDDVNVNVEVVNKENDVDVVEYEPHITREIISKYEYVRVITAVAKYLYSIQDLSKYVEDVEINSIINPCELAFELISKGKFDAVLDRQGYEKVTFSKLKVNPMWVNMLKEYFAEQHKNIENEIMIPLGLV